MHTKSHKHTESAHMQQYLSNLTCYKQFPLSIFYYCCCSQHEFRSLRNKNKVWTSRAPSGKLQPVDTTPTLRRPAFRELHAPVGKEDFVVPGRPVLKRISLDTTPLNFSRHMFRGGDTNGGGSSVATNRQDVFIEFVRGITFAIPALYSS